MIFTCNVYLGHVSTRFTNHYQLDMDDTKNDIMLGISILKRKFLKQSWSCIQSEKNPHILAILGDQKQNWKVNLTIPSIFLPDAHCIAPIFFEGPQLVLQPLLPPTQQVSLASSTFSINVNITSLQLQFRPPPKCLPSPPFLCLISCLWLLCRTLKLVSDLPTYCPWQRRHVAKYITNFESQFMCCRIL